MQFCSHNSLCYAWVVLHNFFCLFFRFRFKYGYAQNIRVLYLIFCSSHQFHYSFFVQGHQVIPVLAQYLIGFVCPIGIYFIMRHQIQNINEMHSMIIFNEDRFSLQGYENIQNSCYAIKAGVCHLSSG